METKIISGFPGVGKSCCTAEHPDWLDSDSSQFSWLRDEHGKILKDENGKDRRNPNFPNNYIQHIQKNIGKTPVIFVSTHAEVLDALEAHNIPYMLVYPERDLKQEYLTRFTERGNPQPFLNMMNEKWDDFLGQLENRTGCQERIVLKAGKFLSHAMVRVLPEASASVALAAGSWADRYQAKKDKEQNKTGGGAARK